MTKINSLEIRQTLAGFPSDHDAAGSQSPKVEEIFTPRQHASALDPNTPIVVGARGAGKSFWAGVLAKEDTRAVAASAYQNLQLDKLIVVPGYTGFDDEDGITRKIIDVRVPAGEEEQKAGHLWNAVILRSALAGLGEEIPSLRKLMEEKADPEDFLEEIKRIDRKLESRGKVLLVTFDALDTLSRDWKRSGQLLDALFEVIWSLRARRCIRAKIFIRPEQLADENLRFVEMPKLRSGRIELAWTQMELYGLLFWRLYTALKDNKKSGFAELALQAGASLSIIEKSPRDWPLLIDANVQKSAMTLISGPYMGSSAKRGGTYDWPYKHLADAKGNVTPRSFIQLFVGAAQYSDQPSQQVLSPKAIQEGLRRASKVRVDELSIEYPWIKRALLPLVGLIVPCERREVHKRWRHSKTVETILDASRNTDSGFMPPFPKRAEKDQDELLAEAMEKIGVLASRSDNRLDMPDLFRVAARMLKKGSISIR